MANLLRLLVAALFPIIASAGLQAQQAKVSKTHAIVGAAELKWTPIISGWEIAVVSGDPDMEGQPFTIGFHGQDGAKTPPHWHPTEENITVLKGMFLVGFGEKYDEGQLQAMNVGSFLGMPKEMRHFARAKGDTIIQAHGTGPFKVNWVNPAEVVPPSYTKR